MQPTPPRLRLMLDGEDVGGVDVAHEDNAWQFGVFEPTPRFGRFAGIFSRWAELMRVPVERAGAAEANAWARRLRIAEQAVDRVRAELLFPDGGRQRRISQLNIDPPLIEWLADETPREPLRRAAGDANQEGAQR